MRTFHFDKNKYGASVQMDLARFEETPVFFFSPEVHCTDFFEILIFREGNGFLLLDGKKIPLAGNTFIFVSPFQKRQWYVDRAGIAGFFLIFEKDFLNDFFADKFFVYRLQYFFNHAVLPVLVPDKRLFSFEHDIFSEILKEIRQSQNDSVHLLRSILYYILVKLNREFCRQHQLPADTQLYPVAYRFKEAVEQHIRHWHQVNDYAAHLHLSRIALNTAVKKQFGRTASALIKERLLHEVKDLLLFTDLTIAEIAYELHFSEPQHLIRFFRQHAAQTPLEFRVTYQNGYSAS